MSYHLWFEFQPQEQIKEDFCARHLPPMLAAYENFLSSSEWFAGASLTYVDFVMYELLDWIRLFDQRTFAKMEKLAKFMERLVERSDSHFAVHFTYHHYFSSPAAGLPLNKI